MLLIRFLFYKDKTLFLNINEFLLKISDLPRWIFAYESVTFFQINYPTGLTLFAFPPYYCIQLFLRFFRNFHYFFQFRCIQRFGSESLISIISKDAETSLPR